MSNLCLTVSAPWAKENSSHMFEPHNFSTHGSTAENRWAELQSFANAMVGFKLFTVMTFDMTTLTAQRVYTDNSEAYPVSGTKPITFDHWFDVVYRQKQIFVANTISEIAEVFPDHQKIWSLGCGSVVNLPVIVEGELVATINMLHEEHYYTPARINLISNQLTEPSRLTYLRVKNLAQQ
jgi:hypothetical protein